jgi:hypothetical protein
MKHFLELKTFFLSDVFRSVAIAILLFLLTVDIVQRQFAVREINHNIRENQLADIEEARMNAARGELIQISLFAALEGRKLNVSEVDRIKSIWKQSDLMGESEAK